MYTKISLSQYYCSGLLDPLNVNKSKMSNENTNFKNICSVSLKLQMQPSEVFAPLQKFLNPTKSGPIESPKIFELLFYIFSEGEGIWIRLLIWRTFFCQIVAIISKSPHSAERHFFPSPGVLSITHSHPKKVFCPPSPSPQK